MKKLVIAFVCVSVSFLSFTEKGTNEVAVAQDQNIVQVAAGNENFTTLVAAVKAAGLVDVLSGTMSLQYLHPQTQHLINYRKELSIRF